MRSEDPAPANASAPTSPYRYWAFISYSSLDASWARWLHRAIETYGVPAKLISHPTPTGDEAPPRLRPVFHDRVELPAASDLGAQIEEALAASRYLIVVCSPNAAASQWVDKEIETFRRVGDASRILAIIIDGEPNAGDETECFPPELRKVEPIAADARAEGDGKTNAKLKLLAGMLGVGFDDLKQRDSARRIRRLQAGIAAALVLAAAFAGLAVYANAQRVAAVEARKEAETQRTAAVEARGQAEGLLDYLVNDLSEQLEPIGRLDIVKNVQDRIDQYYAEYGSAANESSDLSTQITAMLKKGARLEAQGDMEGAEREYRAALALAVEQTRSDPKGVGSQTSLANCRLRLSWVLLNAGETVDALRECRAALKTTESFSGPTAKSEDVQYSTALGHWTLGHILAAKGDADGALSEYRLALPIYERLATSHPDNEGYSSSCAYTLSAMGRLLADKGEWRGALDAFRSALTIDDRLATADPRDAGRQYDLASDHQDAGSALQEMGDLEAALGHYRAGLSIVERLAAQDPTNALWQRDLSSAHISIGNVRRGQGNPAGGLAEYRIALEIAQRVVRSSSGDAEAEAHEAMCHLHIAYALEELGDDTAALSEFRTAQTAFERLSRTDPENGQIANSASEALDGANRLSAGGAP